MPVNSKYLNFFYALLLLATLTSIVSAQQGSSSTAFSRTRTMAESSAAASTTPGNYAVMPTIPLARELVVEEILNYHHHNLAMPTAGEAVAIDLRWGNDRVNLNQPEAILQLGFTTAEFKAQNRAQLRPLNLTLVIDKSGSMSGEKIVKVQEALLSLIGQLRPIDIISIVAFDDSASVLLPPQSAANKQAIGQAIVDLRAGGGTDIYKGLMLGFQQVAQNLRRNYTNRVIMLTDGISEPGNIFAESLKYNHMGIDLATIGIGADVNEQMLRQLAKQGHGLFHFVADLRDIKKIFEKELESLLSPVARDVHLELAFDQRLVLDNLYGYQPQLKGNKLTLDLDDMNHGLTQVVMMKFKLKNGSINSGTLPVNVRLSYYDVDQDRTITRSQTIELKVAAGHQRQSPNSASNGNILMGANTIDPDDLASDDNRDNGEIYSVNELGNDANSNGSNQHGNQHSKKQSRKKTEQSNRAGELLSDNEVRKNYAIATMAQSLHDMATAWQAGNFKQAELIATAGITEVRSLYNSIGDKDITRVLDILQQYQQAISTYNQQAKIF